MNSGLLGLLGPDPVKASQAYAGLTRALRRFFEYRGFDEVEDLVHEVLLRGWERIVEGVPIASAPLAYFYGIARNVALEQSRVRKHEPMGDMDIADDYTLYHNLEPGELRVLYAQCLAYLTEHERALLIDYVDGVATASGISKGAVTVRICRIRKKLEALLNASCEKKMRSDETNCLETS